MTAQDKKVLILCKTYPSPSAKYSETSCVAGMDENGDLIRLYPIPFRLIEDDQQFKKWQWISAKLEKSRNDHRPESHKLYVDTIRCDGKPLSSENNWYSRRPWLDKLPVYESFSEIEAARTQQGVSLALLRPSRIVSLEIKKAGNPEWTEEEKEKLVRLQQQGDLFDESDRRCVSQLRKLPYDFYYSYEYDSPSGVIRDKKKIVDWEVGALYWNVRRKHGEAWEQPFRAKLEQQLPEKDLMFLLGTIHRFPDQWLIISLIYPPKLPPSQSLQGSLF